jgi:hypothetical protein
VDRTEGKKKGSQLKEKLRVLKRYKEELVDCVGLF